MRDIDIRNVLLQYLQKKYNNDPGTLIIEELGLCQGEARIDIAVVNGLIHGYEIKSDQDTLKRLAGQVAIYCRVLDSITLVVSSEHLDEALKIIPKWWEVIVTKEKKPGRLHLQRWRKGKSNPSLDPFAVVQLLWRDEAFEALKKYDLQQGLANKPRTIIWEKLVEYLPTDELLALVRTLLKSRENWRSGCRRA